MNRPLGIRTEIVIASSLLVGAALVLITYVLLLLTETKFLNQSIKRHTDETINLCMIMQEVPESSIVNILETYTHHNNISSWSLIDQQMLVLSESPTNRLNDHSKNDLHRALIKESPLIRFNYSGSWRSWISTSSEETQYVEITSHFTRETKTYALQIRYSLVEIVPQMYNLASLAFALCLGYGLILVTTAVVILNKSIIQPITLLTKSTLLAANGDLNQKVPENGPREIKHLGSAFNNMTQNLQKSISQQLQQYQQLQQTNNELKTTKQHLAHSERIASVGNLASGIAHELGNPLSATIGYLELLKNRTQDLVNSDLITRTLSETNRMDQLIREMLDFSSPGAQNEQSSCQPSEILQQTCQMLKLQGSLKNHILHQYPGNLPSVPITALKLQQILVNLILNAQDSLDKSGEITLTGNHIPPNVIIQVKDNGHGIPPEVFQNLFDPFFTTKQQGKGRGLGLFVSYQLATDAGGNLIAESTPNEGSYFTLTIPSSTSHNKK